tara:strand:+ start:42 stop:644 length:603 start_codon:yes stop_codon:yes gene_type:complete
MTDTIPKNWSIEQLGDHIEGLSNRAIDTDSVPILSVTKHQGFVESLEYFKKQVFSKDLSNYKVVKKGQFAYSTIHLDEGAIALLEDYDQGLISPMYTVFEASPTIDNVFLIYWLKSDFAMAKYQALGQGSVDRRMAISLKTLEEINIPFPPLAEQEKIADILTSLDDQVEAIESKLVQLESLKKSLMGDLFTGRVRVSVD